MLKYKVSQHKEGILLIMLTVLNIILRIPSIPHEKGADSFFIHSLANSISYFGHANWWVHWLSVFGYYPYSYASAIPFSLSGISQLTGIEMENTILLFCIALGLYSIFSAYLLAGVLYDNFLFKYSMAFFYSISQGIMFFTTWEISSRGPLIIFFPIFMYLIMKKFHYAKRLFLIFISSIFLFSIHHLAIILVPVILLYILFNVLQKLPLKNEAIKNKYTHFDYLYPILLITMLTFPFLNSSTTGIEGSRYSWIINSMIIVARFIGPMLFFAFGGLIYLITQKNKKFNIWYFLLMISMFVAFIYDQLYGIFILQIYIIFLLTVGFNNILNLKKIKHSKSIQMLLIVILLSSVTFSSYYNHYRSGNSQDVWHMDEKTFTTGEWINNNIDKDKRVLFVTENQYRVRSIALQLNGSPILRGGTEGLTYGFIDKNSIKNLEKVSLTDSYFYSESPYKMTTRDIFQSENWYIQNKRINKIKEVYNQDYIVQSLSYFRLIGFYESEIDKIFSNGMLEIYDTRNI